MNLGNIKQKVKWMCKPAREDSANIGGQISMHGLGAKAECKIGDGPKKLNE